jgi:mannose-6-phosphate isomerase-like protein (cupin superfamily)
MTVSVTEARCGAPRKLLELLGLALSFAVVTPVWAQIPGQCSAPVAERKSELGCYVDANEELGELPQIPLFWHIYNFRSSAEAHAVKGRRSTVVEAFGRVWLYTIAEKGWHAASGTRVAVVGPLPTVSGKKYTARYMEAAFTAGMQARVHRHSGAEAFYLVTGVQCLETPSGIAIAHAGESFVVPEGPPMTVRSVGAETRRSIVLVLHDTSQPWQTLTNEWTPPGSCPE